MNRTDAIETLRTFDKKGKVVFTKHDLRKLFLKDNSKTLNAGLNRLVKTGLLKHACRGIYVNENAHSFNSYIIEQIAKSLRRNEYNYISLESALSEYGLISQVPVGVLTVMTTGRKGRYKTPYGIIEFTHTKRTVNNILEHILTKPERPLRIATKETALRDLKRVGRNLHLITENKAMFQEVEKIIK